MNGSTFSNRIERNLSKKFKLLEISSNAYYYHPTFQISNLWEYIQIITAISSLNEESIYSKTVVYRGVADYEYDLRPGLARRNTETDLETTLINDFITKRPDAFQNLSDFDILAKMQHYGLPTRLLDFSTNPLVALYFACEKKTRKDGRVLCHNAYLENDTADIVKAICKAAIWKPIDENYTLEEYLCDEITLEKYLISTYLSGDTLVVKPKYWNKRIANQSGVFMVFPNNIKDRYQSILSHTESLGIDQAVSEYGRGKINKTAVLNAFNKETISRQAYNIQPYVTDSFMKKIRSSYSREEFWKAVEMRFNMRSELKQLSNEMVKDSFCSVIIKSSAKARILRDLSSIGISADYIYPELEYTAKEIKRRYNWN